MRVFLYTRESNPMMVLFLALAVFLVAAALTAILASSRMVLKGRVQHWTGESISVTESHRRHARIRWLRLGAGACILLLAADAIAIYTAASYAAAH